MFVPILFTSTIRKTIDSLHVSLPILCMLDNKDHFPKPVVLSLLLDLDHKMQVCMLLALSTDCTRSQVLAGNLICMHHDIPDKCLD